jgi:oxygen-dependent protoporphyrinogen oxidase
LGIQGSPAFHHIVHHRQALPQYRIGHRQRVARVESMLAAWPGLALAGAAYRGLGVPQCIRSGQEAADSVLRYLAHANAVRPH